MSIVEFKPRPKKHRIDRKPEEWPRCEHTHLIYDPRRRTVACKDCEESVDPFDALVIVAKELWWNEQRCERQIEYDEKQVSRVQRAAIENLYLHGITPEIYAERWAKQDALVKAKVASIEEKKRNILSMESGNKSA